MEPINVSETYSINVTYKCHPETDSINGAYEGSIFSEHSQPVILGI